MSAESLRAGRAYFVGWQSRMNEVQDGPPRRYLCELSAAVAERGRYAGGMGFQPWRADRIFLVHFVDTETKMLYSQPDALTAPDVREQWERDAVAQWNFDDAREFARWLRSRLRVESRGSSEKLGAEEWTRYVSGAFPKLPPVPLEAPRGPAEDYADSGWAGWKDWYYPPSKSKVSTTESLETENTDARERR